MIIFRIVEINKSYDFNNGVGSGWIYASNDVSCYFCALKEAIRHEKETGLKTWVELITDRL